MNNLELAALTSFSQICAHFHGNKRSSNYTELVEDLLVNYKGAVSDEQGERFHQDISVMERRYQGRWDPAMMDDFCWVLQNEDDSPHKKKNYFVPTGLYWFLKVSGEKLSSQPELVDPFKLELKNKIQELNLTLDQLYNADETGLYWKLLPDRTFVSSTEKTAPGRKTEKQRITFFACTNATGNHKVKPLVIGKAKTPRAFKNFACPVDYDHSKSAWMTAAIFKNWFHMSFVPQVRRFLKSKGLPIKALLVLDNAPSHPPEEDLKSKDGEIVTMYLPPNVTPLIRSMDQNVIRLTKLYYRKSLLASIVANDSNITESLKSLTIKDAIVNLMGAWNRLDSKMIAKCWRNILQVSENNEDEDDLPLSVLRTRYLDNVGSVSEVSDLLNTVLPENTFKEVDVLEWNSIDDQCTNQSDDEDNEPQSNGTVERFHRSLKAALMYRQASWSEALPLVLRGLRTTIKEDLEASPADLVYGTALQLPRDMIRTSTPASMDNQAPTPHFAEELRSQMNAIPYTASQTHGKNPVYLPRDLQQAKYVFVRVDAVRKPLQPLYDGPYKVLARNPKYFSLQIKNKRSNVSIDRLKPVIDQSRYYQPWYQRTSDKVKQFPRLRADESHNTIRSAIANLEKISSTDIKCYWDKNKKEAGDGFHAKPLADLMCAKSKATQDIQDVKP
ncbi:hypothetical protein GEV33_007503 [Tenebrio molitor]|uniref:DDE-1 domain-containing protein n=2 Tax=Tenebrio molitor TaxID=7067 RepID=A0A8J6LCZ5_TENMO|nr:hypothetical protein GEV33_007503 [Tenebrio molitor]